MTVFDPDERYAAGDTPNQNPGEPGLPAYMRLTDGPEVGAVVQIPEVGGAA